MCGISGIINLNHQTILEASIKKMMLKIKHRGPDDEGTFLDKNIGLGFVRLSILDLSPAGHQPMHSSDDELVIVFNGEIFNYIELREELKQQGYTFKTQTDTEVLLNAYKAWGQDCLHKLNGMWAFVIYDKKNNTVFASRDRYGIKPFYYTIENGKFIFASEIPAILEVSENQISANNHAIFDFLVFNRTDQSEETFFENIYKLKHGHSIFIELNNTKSKFRVEKWYDLRTNLKEAFSSKEEYYKLFKDSVELRMRSDVPVGVCLSGGLDSSSILSVLLTEKKNEDINTFSAIYKKGEKGDESEFIDLYKDKVKHMHFTTPDGEALLNDLDSFVKAHGGPIPSTSAYAQYRVMHLAKGKVTVTMDGQGADEQLAGYHYFFGLYYKELLLKFKWLKLIKEILAYLRKHKSLFALKTFVFFLLPKKTRTKLRVSEKGYLDSAFNKQYSGHSEVAGNIYGSSSLKEALIDHFEYKMEHHLKWGDFNSMWHSIESRMPFLDHRLVEKTISLSSDQIIHNGNTKFILREAMRGILPDRITDRIDKVGFATPEGEWFREKKFRAFIEDILNSSSFANRGIINIEKANALFKKHLSREVDISKEIWKWVHLELWFREFVDPKSKVKSQNRVCTLGVWDQSVPGIKFDKEGVSNYSKIYLKMAHDFPRGKKGEEKWLRYVDEIKNTGKNKKYDCIIGVSGGTDSSYLLHLAKTYGLNPLAIYLDNGWASETAVSNIEKMTRALSIDLETYVIDYNEVIDVLRAYIKAGLPWVDAPTDLAIKAILYKKAAKYGLKHVLIGHDFRTEGFQPTEWTYSDSKQLKFLTKQFSNRTLTTYPTLSFFEFVWLSYFKKIKLLRPFFYLDYNKTEAKKLLKEKYDWKDYGGHHYENIFTKFIITYWLFEKFGIDKRKITNSALILNGELARVDALAEINKKPYEAAQIKHDIEYLCKKLNFTSAEFDKFFKSPNHTYLDYPSYFPIINKLKKIAYPLVKYFLPNKPLFIYQSEGRDEKINA
ncbi:MAG: asparagine synthase (glutamine-hydrolyzing) [Bacteroidota bacterium]|nr:asparagine synthase (glutamine-hydrolyzing) [Bacteroidota bacterium]MDP3144340.1 asparagine synthase (glutamine-hydrolyzing) [Bacteroidota bacterium]